MKIRKAVFPAAGFGTRFLPATKAIPKEMLPLIDKPLIQYSVEEAKKSGLEEVIIITGMGKTAIEDHFDVSFELEMLLKERNKTDMLKMIEELSNFIHFSYTRQKKPMGLGHAIHCAKNLVGMEPFAVFLSDDVIDSRIPVMKQMVDVFHRYPYTILAVQRVPKKEVHHYGIIEARKIAPRVYEVLDMVEKPHPSNAPSNLAIIGRYILMPEIFKALEETKPGRGGEIQLTDGLKVLSRKQPIYAYEFEGERFDAGDKLGFIKANVSFALKRPDINKSFKKFLKEISH
ncbi:MAG: UTP--glucose-1-phosphate uridylyltransferase [Deltaproteobacteria bacterium GWC2_42_51]|nr:MAG: UTP--glucose-1-phosphate uridylyltransferase [Deltaproteobacteria bacterium GWA2_42_85]OGP22893.1 MAG: UTP--glucose-1-phosphate uridylyltransferase [Deltaproteobacteria bacterium GWB2_42_7]OGP31666.1 MAG: UTP--glucose-1-phosphate uridylyltransferase [Deltaproteobacteria bacterium GWC2_42_51]OGQ30043.1 MAG: UTP--glucose-1-phosphate uridylyltransferase [Deltaproteobacteria bacterium RIFCSPHIGHO2_02_FULL_42_44]OGQ35330.1 MAG: UTP--glucose-1-phosphate uridylyltransferase [Deltaproteobacteri